MPAYRIHLYETLSTTTDFLLIPAAHVINLSIMEEGNANQDPFEFVGSRAKVTIFNYSAYDAILDMDRNDLVYNRLVRIFEDGSNVNVFTGAILIEDLSVNYLNDTIEFTVSDSLRVWIAKAKDIDLDGGQYNLDSLFATPLQGYGDLNQMPFILGFLDANIVNYSFSSLGLDYLPYSYTWNNNPVAGGVNSDLFDSDDNPAEWKVVSRQATIHNGGSTIGRFFIIRKFLGSTLLFRCKWQVINLDTSRLVQGIYTQTTGTITVPQTLSYPTAFNYMKTRLISNGVLPSGSSYTQTIVTEYENGEPANPTDPFNPGEAVNSLVPLFSQTQLWDYSSGEQTKVNKYGRIGGKVNLSKSNLICEPTTLARTLKAFCLLLGIGMKGRAAGGIDFFRHIIREFNTTDVITITETDIIDKQVSGMIANYDNAINALDLFEYNGRNQVKFVMQDFFRTLYNDIAMELSLILPKSYYVNNSFAGFAKITIDERNYYALNWTVPLFEDVFTVKAIGGRRIT